jgi:hypothetical protein
VAAAEMAMVLPLLVLIFLGVIEFSRLGQTVQLMTTAAREGCRVASLPGTTTSNVTDHVTSVLSGSGISVSDVTFTYSSASWTTAPQGTPISLRLSVPYSKVSWLSNATFFRGSVINASATFSSEKP